MNGIQIVKTEVKLLLFAGDIILYVENKFQKEDSKKKIFRTVKAADAKTKSLKSNPNQSRASRSQGRGSRACKSEITTITKTL